MFEGSQASLVRAEGGGNTSDYKKPLVSIQSMYICVGMGIIVGVGVIVVIGFILVQKNVV